MKEITNLLKLIPIIYAAMLPVGWWARTVLDRYYLTHENAVELQIEKIRDDIQLLEFQKGLVRGDQVKMIGFLIDMRENRIKQLQEKKK